MSIFALLGTLLPIAQLRGLLIFITIAFVGELKLIELALLAIVLLRLLTLLPLLLPGLVHFKLASPQFEKRLVGRLFRSQRLLQTLSGGIVDGGG